MIKRIWIVVVCLTCLTGTAHPGARGADFDPAPYLGIHWYGVYLMGTKVGYGSFRLTSSTYQGRPSYTSEFSIFYRLNLGGKPQEMSLREEKIYLPQEGLTAFVATQDSILGKSSFTGRKKGDRFVVTTATGTETIPAVAEDLQDALADLILVRSKAPPGTVVETAQLESTLLTTIRIIHTVDAIEKRFIGGVPTDIYRIRSEFPGLGITTFSLIDQHLHILEAKVSVLTIREEGEEEAKDTGYASDLLLVTSVKPDRPVPDPQRARSLTIKLSGIDDPGLIIPSPRQQFTELDPQTYYLKIAVQEDPVTPGRRIPVLDPDLKDYLNPTAYIQSTHPSIRLLARKIVGQEDNARAVTTHLVDWIYANLEKSFLAAIPNAVDVLKKRSGDCKAHAVLLVALARSLGLPARRVSGLVETGDGAFYYHQWAEVYTGRWVPVDPVFGQVPADATHIKLSQGDLSEQLRILNVIGAISIEVLDYEVAKDLQTLSQTSKY
jgi:hypothetical protein